MKMKVAAFQTGPIEGAPEQTVQRALQLLDRAGEQKVKLAVFPESYYPGSHLLKLAKNNPDRYDALFSQFKALAEPVPGPTSSRISDKAREHGMHVVFTMAELGPNGRLYNASVLIDHQGQVLNVHRKTILTPTVETPEFTPGNEFNVTDTSIGNIGQLICADSSCPESSRILAIKGAQIVCLSMGGFRVEVNGRDMMGAVMDLCHASKTRAVDNSIFLIVANLSCRIGAFEYFGKSRIINYLGEVLAMGSEGPDREELVIAEIDVDDLAMLPLRMMSRRRPEIYKEILLPNPEAKGVDGRFLWSSTK
ncbi:MAG: carbon-nitrogen hydrolase family protein [Candidatus Abyssobacteria bacterium SURF_17]|uniref:Carbon-nitrogen hydrolase family protein n=1 Tax=Candidatus Abyssobacteria bacterium SURF_17 TaxID=2093361 RepID=A0A419EW55_9BACT|nr:MAG: carbon-nitrogen hydrolase family protein [Candidatus Abyssubacteria bacterium SURF_17]